MAAYRAAVCQYRAAQPLSFWPSKPVTPAPGNFHTNFAFYVFQFSSYEPVSDRRTDGQTKPVMWPVGPPHKKTGTKLHATDINIPRTAMCYNVERTSFRSENKKCELQCSGDAHQHQFNFVRSLSWSFFSNVGESSLLKFVSSACYDARQVCVYLQPLSC